MKIGVHLPQWGPLASRPAILAVARTAEEAGLDSLWVADHVAYPIDSTSQYPYRSKGLPFSADEGFLEAVTQLAVVAGATSRIGLGTSVLVLPMREPLLLAKMFATLDVLSCGRTMLAVGAGWWKEEFSAVGAAFSGRGERMDEQLAILKAAWSQRSFAFHGRDYEFGEVASLPHPVQPGGPPVLIGGNGPRSWRRAGTLGDGWHAVGLDVESLRLGRDEVRRIAADAGRDPNAMIISTSTGMGRSIEHSVDRLAQLVNAQVSQVVLNVASGEGILSEYCAAIETLAGSVLPQLQLS